MKHYRNQPQASSHVYRSVLLRKKDSLGSRGDKTHTEVGNEIILIAFTKYYGVECWNPKILFKPLFIHHFLLVLTGKQKTHVLLLH